jgi:hypothetical protein
MRTPFRRRPQDPDLLRTYLVRQHRRRLALVAFGFGTFVALAGLAALWTARTGDPAPVGAFALLLALSGLAVFGLAWAAGAYWAGWSYANLLRRKGQTRPALWHVVGFFACSGLLALPFGALALWEEAPWRFWLVCGFVTWHTASSCTLGYLAPFWFRPPGGDR